MALIVRCPTCGCIYQVTSEQLERDGGRLRCGICQTRFSAEESLRVVDDTDLQLLLRGDVPASNPAPEPVQRPRRTEPVLGTVPQQQKTDPAPAGPRFKGSFSPRMPEGLSFKKKKTAGKTASSGGHGLLWATGALILFLVVAWQLLSLFGPALSRHSSAVAGLRQAVCTALPCPGPGSESRNPFTVEEFALVPKTVDTYEVSLVLANNSTRDLPLPKLEVSFKDSRGAVTIRKILKPEDYTTVGAKTLLPPAQSLPVRFAFNLSGGRPTSCTVRALPQ